VKQPSNREFPYETTDQSYIHSHVFSPDSQHKAATLRRSLQELLLQKADANEAPWLYIYIEVSQIWMLPTKENGFHAQKSRFKQ
jgi:hypothetical protein